MRAHTDDAAGVRFTSWARFVADLNGILDLSLQAPLEGSYVGVDPSGLLWSMTAGDDVLFITDSQWAARTITFSAETANGVQRQGIIRRYPWPDTTRREVQAPGLVAELTLPISPSPSHGPHAVIVLLSGWGDGPAPLKAALLAARGYAVLNVGYHHWPGVPEHLVEIPVETVVTAIDWIEQDERLDASRVGVYGTSKGAELALLAAIHDPRLRAVAAWVPSSVVFAGIVFGDPNPGSSWSVDGRPLPYATMSPGLAEIRNGLRFLLKRPMIFRKSYARALAKAPAAAFLKVENIGAALLLVSGSDDQMWPSSVMANQIERRLEEMGRRHELVNLVFDGAGHGISKRLWPTGGRRSVLFHRGGSPGPGLIIAPARLPGPECSTSSRGI